jgi:CheY-like chemotaxis protein
MTNRLDKLIWDLRSFDQEVYGSAIKKLVEVGPRAVEPLIAALGGDDSRVRTGAIEALGRIGDARAVEPLVDALGDRGWQVREKAADALGMLGDARAVEPLTACLEDEDSDVRKAAAEALDRLGWKAEGNAAGAAYWVAKQDWEQCLALGDPAVDSLIAALGDKHRVVRKAVAEILGKLNSDRAMDVLVVTLRDYHGDVRSSAAEALDKLKWKPQTDEQEVDYWIAKEDWGRCADIGEPAIKPLIHLIDNIYPWRPPPGADDTIRHVLVERFGSYPSVIKAMKRRRILIAEDERDMRELIGFTMRFAGFDVILTCDGTEALEKAPWEQPDLILLDVRMPKITGYEVCRKLKKNPDTMAIPVVFLSAKGQEGEIRQGMESGAVEYIVKPFAPDELTNQVRDVLRRCELGIYEED